MFWNEADTQPYFHKKLLNYSLHVSDTKEEYMTLWKYLTVGPELVLGVRESLACCPSIQHSSPFCYEQNPDFVWVGEEAISVLLLQLGMAAWHGVDYSQGGSRLAGACRG